MPIKNKILLLQVFLGHSGVCDVEGNELPRLIYVSREKRPGFDHHKNAGAMNALVRLKFYLSDLYTFASMLLFWFLLHALFVNRCMACNFDICLFITSEGTGLGSYFKCSLSSER